MILKKELKTLFTDGHKTHLRNISVDCIIFGFHQGELKVLLAKPYYSDLMALPGGFVKLDENMDDAAQRILKERTGLQNIFLQQFHAFGDAARTTQKNHKQFLQANNIELNKSWIFDRFVTVGYYALVNFFKVNVSPDAFSANCDWYAVTAMPELILDHADIFKNAMDYLRRQLNYHQVGVNLLPAKFTMPELQKLYETILGYPLDRRNFQRKIIGVNILKRLGERKAGVAHKAPYLYKFDKRKNQKPMWEGKKP